MDYVANNITNATEQDYPPYSARIETYLVPILFGIIFLSGIVGNWTVCVIFIKHPSMRNVPNTYVSQNRGSIDMQICAIFLSCEKCERKNPKKIYDDEENNAINNENL